MTTPADHQHQVLAAQANAQRRREVAVLKSRLSKLEATMADLADVNAQLLQQHTELLAKVAAMVEIFDAAIGAFKVLIFIGKVAKPLLVVGTVAAGIVIWWQKNKPF